MQIRRDIGPFPCRTRIPGGAWEIPQAANENAADVVLREIGMVLALALGVALAVNIVLAAMHIG